MQNSNGRSDTLDRARREQEELQRQRLLRRIAVLIAELASDGRRVRLPAERRKT
jgi:hypothetical protein